MLILQVYFARSGGHYLKGELINMTQAWEKENNLINSFAILVVFLVGLDN